MIKISCAACGQILTRDGRWGDISEWDNLVAERCSPVAAGVFVRLPEDSVSILQPDNQSRTQVYSPENAVSAHPEMVIRENLKAAGTDQGCCGSNGEDGPNRACNCGQMVATEWSDCCTLAEIRFLPDTIVVSE
ncbi:hypothetical protein [Sandarakinorhabdus limnophila]|jgi:hypothetical protein|uniref:hypothetical protein n=1 Tax=Sandarakinorhabdus limnophila TaxID=210512 RepID=UPI00235474C9|nr:hypothetical protein [Sandarakinorhabdus limnophila]